jgi:hypothetical protein
MATQAVLSSKETQSSVLLADYLTETALAGELGITVRGLRSWRTKRQGPAWTKLGSKILYRRDAFHAWLKAQEHQPVRPSPRSRRDTVSP